MFGPRARHRGVVAAALAPIVVLAPVAACQLLGDIESIELAADGADADGANTNADGGVAVVEGGIADGAFATDALGHLPGCGANAKCVARPPVGWLGPIYVYEGPTGTPAPTCPTDTAAFAGNANLSLGGEQCAACQCTTPSGRTCKAVGQAYTALGCMEGSECGGSRDIAVPTSCKSIESDAGCTTKAFALTVTQTGGTCSPVESAPQPPAVSWSVAGVGCNAAIDPGGTCEASSVCALVADAPYAGTLCIMKAAAEPCPAGPFTEQHVYYESHDDARTCSACTCDAPDGGACTTGFATLYYNSSLDCSGSSNGSGLGCRTIDSSGSFRTSTTLGGAPPSVLSPGACAPSGGKPGGSVTPKSPTTVCCLL